MRVSVWMGWRAGGSLWAERGCGGEGGDVLPRPAIVVGFGEVESRVLGLVDWFVYWSVEYEIEEVVVMRKGRVTGWCAGIISGSWKSYVDNQLW